jgi:hypothetical protein
VDILRGEANGFVLISLVSWTMSPKWPPNLPETDNLSLGIEEALMFRMTCRLLFPGRHCQGCPRECQLEDFEKEWRFEVVPLM